MSEKSSFSLGGKLDTWGEEYQNTLPANIRKQLGSHYTQFKDAWKLSESILDRVQHPITRVLEPSCGGGAFACAVYHGLKERGYDGLDIINNILVCVDIDDDAAALTVKILKALEPLSTPQVIVGDTLLIANTLGKFDIVIGNPPYVRTHNIDEGKKTLYRGRYPCFSGLADLSTAFVEMGFDLLNDKGYLGYIITNKFARSLAGKLIRDKIANHLVEFDERGKTDKFKAGVEVVDLVLHRGDVSAIPLLVNGEVKSRHLIGENEWTFQENKTFTGKTLAELGVKLQLGVVSGFNEVMVGNHPDVPWTRAVVQGKDMTATKRIIYIQGTPPQDALEYLEPHREKLTERAGGKRNWWELQCPAPSIRWDEEKYVVRRIGGSLRKMKKIGKDVMALDTCYVLVVPAGIDADKLVQVLGFDEINIQVEQMMNKIGDDAYEIHSKKFGRIIIPEKYLEMIRSV